MDKLTHPQMRIMINQKFISIVNLLICMGWLKFMIKVLIQLKGRSMKRLTILTPYALDSLKKG